MALGRLVAGVVGLSAIHGGLALLASSPAEPDSCNKTCLMETAGIRSSFSTLPRRSLTEHERAVLEDDGVVLLRSVVTNRKVLKTLEENLWQIVDEGTAYGSLHRNRADSWNAGVRAMVEDPLFASLVASAFPPGEVPTFRDMQYQEAPVFGFHGTSDGKMERCKYGYHFDEAHRRSSGHSCKMVTLWLALTDGATYPVEFVRGSHKVRRELEEGLCATWKVNVVANVTYAAYEKDCADQLVVNATRRPGPAWSTDMRAGDAFMFTGDILHMGILQPTPRLAISLRWDSPEVGGRECLYPDPQWYPPGHTPTPE